MPLVDDYRCIGLDYVSNCGKTSRPTLSQSVLPCLGFGSAPSLAAVTSSSAAMARTPGRRRLSQGPQANLPSPLPQCSAARATWRRGLLTRKLPAAVRQAVKAWHKQAPSRLADLCGACRRERVRVRFPSTSASATSADASLKCDRTSRAESAVSHARLGRLGAARMPG